MLAHKPQTCFGVALSVKKKPTMSIALPTICRLHLHYSQCGSLVIIISFSMRLESVILQVATIILYDYTNPSGAFHKKSTIDVSWLSTGMCSCSQCSPTIMISGDNTVVRSDWAMHMAVQCLMLFPVNVTDHYWRFECLVYHAEWIACDSVCVYVVLRKKCKTTWLSYSTLSYSHSCISFWLSFFHAGKTKCPTFEGHASTHAVMCKRSWFSTQRPPVSSFLVLSVAHTMNTLPL